LCWQTAGTALKLQEFLEREMERDEEPFDLDDDFVAGGEEEDYDRFIERVDRRKQAVKKGKAAWSKLEDVLAEKRLQKELRDYYEDQ
jgi:hypothetical protein